MKPQWKIHRATIALLCAVAVSGCDSRQPLSPTTRTVARRASVDAPQALGGGFVPAPSNTSPTAVSNPSYVNLLTLPESTWVVLNVTGSVELTWNEAPCAQRLVEAPHWPCQDGSPLVNFDARPWEGGPVWLRTGEGSGGLVRLRRTGGANSGAAVGLYYAAQAVTLTGHVNMIAQWAPDPNFGDGPFSYHVSGGYSVAATAVPSPLQLTEGEPDSTGKRPYAVEALYGLQFINPAGYPGHIPAGATFWRFFPGDSVGDTPDRTGGGWDVRECQNLMICRYRPPVPGRMQVQAYVEGQFADVRSKRASGSCENASSISTAAFDVSSGAPSICETPPHLEVTCTPNVTTRGGSIVCEANARPRGDLQVTKWWFDDDHGNIVRPSDPQQDSADYWGGRMAVSGTVHVEGEIDGHAVAGDSARLTVEGRRPWGLTYPTRPGVTYTRDSLRYPPVAAYGDTIRDGVLGAFKGAQLSLSYGVGSGPNEGVSYVRSIQWQNTPLFIWINAGLQPGDPWYQAQRGPTPSRPRGCGRAFLERHAVHVPAHEGRHYDIDRSFFEDPTTFASLETAVEFRGTPGRIEALVDSIYGQRQLRQAVLDAVDKGLQDCDPYPLPAR